MNSLLSDQLVRLWPCVEGLGRADLGRLVWLAPTWRRQARYRRQTMKRRGRDNAATGAMPLWLAATCLAGGDRRAIGEHGRCPCVVRWSRAEASILLHYGQAAAAQLGQQDHESTAAAGGSIQRRLVRSQAHAPTRTHTHAHAHALTHTHSSPPPPHTQTSQHTTPHTTPHHAHTHTLTHTIVRVLQGPGE